MSEVVGVSEVVRVSEMVGVAEVVQLFVPGPSLPPISCSLF